MSMNSERIEAAVGANAALLGLRIAAEHRAGVMQFFALAASMAELVYGLPLAAQDESGSVFAPVPPSASDRA
jgi:hypothetical protein